MIVTLLTWPPLWYNWCSYNTPYLFILLLCCSFSFRIWYT